MDPAAAGAADTSMLQLVTGVQYFWSQIMHGISIMHVTKDLRDSTMKACLYLGGHCEQATEGVCQDQSSSMSGWSEVSTACQPCQDAGTLTS